MLDQIENCERLCPKAEQFEGLDGFLTMGIQHGWTYLRPAGDARRDHEIDMAEPSAEPSTELNILKRSVYISGKTLKNRAGEPTGTKAFLPWKSPQIGDLRVRWEVVSPQTVHQCRCSVGRSRSIEHTLKAIYYVYDGLRRLASCRCILGVVLYQPGLGSMHPQTNL
jgi:hypothetical protein